MKKLFYRKKTHCLNFHMRGFNLIEPKDYYYYLIDYKYYAMLP